MLITSVCAGTLPSFPGSVYVQEGRCERVKGEFQARRERNGEERKEWMERGEKEERWDAINEEFGAPLARCPFYHLLAPSFHPSSSPLLSNLEISSVPGPARISHS